MLASPAPVAVVIATRNRGHELLGTLTRLRALDEQPLIMVVDNGSTDGTADVVRAVAGDKVQLLTGEPLPPGWLGKPYACRQLADAVPG